MSIEAFTSPAKIETKSCKLREASCRTLVLQASACAFVNYGQILVKQNAPQARFFHDSSGTRCAAGKMYQTKCTAGQIFLTEF